jgi:hypothetical protein
MLQVFWRCFLRSDLNFENLTKIVQSIYKNVREALKACTKLIIMSPDNIDALSLYAHLLTEICHDDDITNEIYGRIEKLKEEKCLIESSSICSKKLCVC